MLSWLKRLALRLSCLMGSHEWGPPTKIEWAVGRWDLKDLYEYGWVQCKHCSTVSLFRN